MINIALQGARAQMIKQRMDAVSQAMCDRKNQDAKRIYQGQADEAQRVYQQATATSKKQLDAALSATLQHYSDTLFALRPRSDAFTVRLDTITPPWNAISWQHWQPSDSVPPLARLGALRITNANDELTSPAFWTFPNNRPIVIKATGAAKAEAIRFVQALLLRLLATLPPGKTRFTFIDPVGLGQNVAAFLRLGDFDTELITGKAWSETRQIEQQLVNITEHMGNVIQKYLRNQFVSIEDYNQFAGEVAEAYRFVVFMDFPVNCTEDAAKNLVRILNNGPRCGVYPIVVVDTAQKPPHNFNDADLYGNATVISWSDPDFKLETKATADLHLRLDMPPSSAVTDAIIKQSGEAFERSKDVSVPFAKMCTLFADQWQQDQTRPLAERTYPGLPLAVDPANPRTWWKGDTSRGVIAPLGRTGATRIQCLAVGKQSQSSGTEHHMLVAGRVGSGKSTLLHTLIMELALNYSPNELMMYLIDFKEGVEFKDYATFALPHARVVSIGSEREFGLSVITGLKAEMERRGELFRDAGGAPDIATYRDTTGQTLPRILLLVDEYQVFFMENDAITDRSKVILEDLVRRGRAFGIHVILCTQTLSGAYALNSSTIGQIAVRVALMCDDKDSRLILADDNPAARLLNRKGEAIYNAMNGREEGNNRFQVAYMDQTERQRLLAQMRTMADSGPYPTAEAQIVFESHAAADVRRNTKLHELIVDPAWMNPAFAARAWLGDPTTIRDPIAAVFRRQGRSNLMIVGQQYATDDELDGGQRDRTPDALLAMTLLSLLAQFPPASQLPGREHLAARFAFIDYSMADSLDEAYFPAFLARFPHGVFVGRSPNLLPIVTQIEAEVRRRLEAYTSGQIADTSADRPGPIFLAINGLQFATALKPDPGYRRETEAKAPGDLFATILREGPSVGVHTILWCDTVSNLKRNLDARSLDEIGLRVVFQMSAEDSAYLVRDKAASQLGTYRLLLHNEQDGRRERFRPYGVPPADWLDDVVKRLAAKQSVGG